MINDIKLKRGIRMVLKFKKGFSLVELLVVIAIIGILAAVGITAYQGYTTGAKEKASAAQHAQVVAIINAEMAKCAGGGSGKDIFDVACSSVRTHGSMVTYFSDVEMMNPYVKTADAVVANAKIDGVAHDKGQIAVFCDDDGKCSVITIGGGETLSKEITAY
jgi:type IV pilus assembly protein PilA